MKNNYKKLIASVLAFAPLSLFAQGPPKVNEATNPQAMALIAIAVILAFAIYASAKMLVQQAKINMKKIKKDTAAKVVSVLLLLFVSTALFAQDATATDAAAQATETVKKAGPLSSTSFYVLVSVIAVELLILISIIMQLRILVRSNEDEPVAVVVAAEAVEEKSFNFKQLWDKLNRFKPIREEADIDMGHDYDGIRELDNRLPPWWLWGFYLCIFVSVIYLWRFHVSHTGLSSVQEYQVAMQEAEEQRAVYLAKAKNNVDENTVTQLMDASDLDAGKKVFTSMCAACHAADGGGTVGPNLTDDYWLHGGGIKNVFKTITYGWPDKGMKSWKDDYSPLQIQQIASYVLSLHGTKPATPKEPQGTIYKEDNAPAADSSAAKDSTATATAFVK